MQEKEDEVGVGKIGDSILKSEFDRALKKMKAGKVTGADEIANELKNAGEVALKRL
ncbi:hypothetical protein PGB90_008722 [Kerria lacca]